MKRTILISGASRGIGRCIAERLLKEGNNLSLGLRDPNVLKGTKLDPQIAGDKNILLTKYDAYEKEDANSWASKTVNKFGQLDTLINCAGIFNNVGLIFKEEEEKYIENLWKVNVMGPWFLTKACWPELIKGENGRILMIISMSGKRSKGNLAGYSTSKFALMGLCQTMRNEGWDKGIRVATINPSWVNTDMAMNINSISKENMTQPEDIAEIANNILGLPNSCIPFEININCNLEK